MNTFLYNLYILYWHISGKGHYHAGYQLALTFYKEGYSLLKIENASMKFRKNDWFLLYCSSYSNGLDACIKDLSVEQGEL